MPIDVTLNGRWTFPTFGGKPQAAAAGGGVMGDGQVPTGVLGPPDGLGLDDPGVLGDDGAVVSDSFEPDADPVDLGVDLSVGDGGCPQPNHTQHHDQIRLADAHKTGATGKGVRVAVLDTGVLRDVVDGFLGDRHLFREGHDLLDQDRKPIAERGLNRKIGADAIHKHGTWSSGILAAGDHVTAAGLPVGVAPEAAIIPFRVGNNPVTLLSPALANGVHLAVGAGVDIISIAMGGLPSLRWAEAINAAYMAGVIVVCAAGNHLRLGGLSTPTWVVHPARWARTIAVGGVTLGGARYANHHLNGTYGNDGPQVDIAAPTPCIPMISTDMWGKVLVRAGGGTTAATAQVSGALALWLERHRAELEMLVDGQGWRRVEYARAALAKSAQALACDPGQQHLGAGRLDVLALLNTAPSAVRIPDGPAAPAAVDELKRAVQQHLGAQPRTKKNLAVAYKKAWFDYVNGPPPQGS